MEKKSELKRVIDNTEKLFKSRLLSEIAKAQKSIDKTEKEDIHRLQKYITEKKELESKLRFLDKILEYQYMYTEEFENTL